MRIVTVREFRDKASAMFRNREPVLVLRRGKVVGIFFPWSSNVLPIELKQEVFTTLAESLQKEAGINDKE